MLPRGKPGRERLMVPTGFASWTSLAALAQTTGGPAVPGAAGAGNGVATQGAPAATGAGTGPAPTGNPFGGMIWILLLGFMLILITSSMGGRKQKKQREAMMAGLHKNDRVLTTAGII